MPQKFKNNPRGVLAGSITAAATSFAVGAGDADRFPVGNTTNWLTPGDWFKATIMDKAGNFEIVRVGQRAGGSATFSNVLRAQEGTTALNFAAGAFVYHTATAEDIERVLAGDFDNLLADRVTTPEIVLGGWTLSIGTGGKLVFSHGGVPRFSMSTTGDLIAQGDVAIDGAP